jgi:hypothetical protein
MGAPEQKISLSYAAAVAAFNHDQMLLRAVHKTQRVLYQGAPHYIQVIRIGPSGGGIESEVYLFGNPVPVPASEITLAPEVS